MIPLFDEARAPLPATPAGSKTSELKAPPRYRSPNRDQIELHPCSLENLVAEDHPVRAVWAFVLGMNLSPLYEGIRAVEGHAGRPAIEPTILVALWLYATIDGVGSARALARLCTEHAAYRWLCDRHASRIAGASPAMALGRREHVGESKGARRNSRLLPHWGITADG